MMNKLCSLNAVRSLTTCSSPLLRNHSVVSSAPSSSFVPALSLLGGVRQFHDSSDSRNSSNNSSKNINNLNNKIDPPINWGIRFVPHNYAYVIERFGKYHTTLQSGLHFLVPFVDRIAYVHWLQEENFNVPGQASVTLDNVRIDVDGVIHLKIENPYLASYGSKRPIQSAIEVAQGIMRSEIGKLTLDDTFKEREKINDVITSVVNEAATAYGLKCVRHVIKDIIPPEKVSTSMESVAAAEREKRVKILVSEGERDAAILSSQGELARELAKVDAELAKVDVELAKVDATAKGISVISKRLMEDGGKEAAGLKVAEQYVMALGNLAKQSTSTVFLPIDATGVSSMISQAISLYKRLGGDPTNGSTGGLIDETVDEEKASKLFLKNENVADEPGFSLQKPK